MPPFLNTNMEPLIDKMATSVYVNNVTLFSSHSDTTIISLLILLILNSPFSKHPQTQS